MFATGIAAVPVERATQHALLDTDALAIQVKASAGVAGKNDEIRGGRDCDCPADRRGGICAMRHG
jgi:hypothetical protein